MVRAGNMKIGRHSFMILLICYWLLFASCSVFSQSDKSINWILADMLKSKDGITVLGSPKLIDSPYGKAVYFDGVDDGILCDEMPLNNFAEYTIEMFIRFDGGNHEQRYFHAGTMRQDRSLMEMRSNANTWYLDGMFESKTKWVVLMDSTSVHPLGEWYHIALAVKDGKQATFVNGQKELEGNVDFAPITEGATSIGVRQNKVSWFKGAIYKIRVTNKFLSSDEFMTN